jgi:hypothetical protein
MACWKVEGWENAEQVLGLRTIERTLVSIQLIAEAALSSYRHTQCFAIGTCIGQRDHGGSSGRLAAKEVAIVA